MGWSNWRSGLMALIGAALLGGCAYPVRPGGDAGWRVLAQGMDTPGMAAGTVAYFSMVSGGVAAAASGQDPALMLTRQSYADFQLRVEFNLGADGEGSVLVRCAPADLLAFSDCYRIPLAARPRPEAPPNGGVVGLPAPRPLPELAEQDWHVLDIEAVGEQLRVVLDGRRLVLQHDRRRLDGLIGLHWGRGQVRFRQVAIRPV